MKLFNIYKLIITSFFLALINFALTAQTPSNISRDDEKKINKQDFVTDSRPVSNNIDSTLYVQIVDRIKNIDGHIIAIDKKIAFINSDQRKSEKAYKDGWFNDMQRIKKELMEEKTLLKSKLP